MVIERRFALDSYNTFRVPAQAAGFCVVRTIEEARALLRAPERNEFPSLYILGGGSNVLFTRDIEALAIKIDIRGVSVVEETDSFVVVECGAGEIWDDFVERCVRNGWYGLENLSLIPGSVGAAPIQNIGAYGAEVQERIASVQGLRIADGSAWTLSREECRFGYRDSVFKREYRHSVITSVTFRLPKSDYAIRTHYGNVQEEILRLFPAKEGVTPAEVRAAISSIRRAKLPDPKTLGNAGSFFKNPEISLELYSRLASSHPDIPSFHAGENLVKIPAAWLIERCGWKGKRLSPTSDAAVHDKQALVLVNHGKATGSEILELASAVRETVLRHFGITLEIEVQIV
jgi:UDP-N-acetylmuramate dehydrogenase